MLKIGIVGGTGYTGAEILRLLIGHPHAQIITITSRGEVGTRVDSLFPNLRGYTDLAFVAPEAAPLEKCDLVFFATPNGTAMMQAPKLLDAGVRIIDLAADFRLRDPAIWQQWYEIQHQCPQLLTEAVYGLPELNRAAITKARLVANPGCYPTAILLGFIPLLEARSVDVTWLVADAKSGVSGAGRKASINMLMGEVGESFKAYNIPGHRHWPEILQVLEQISKTPVNFTFVPHLVPMIRGIEATLYARLSDPACDLQAIFATRYANERFVDVLPLGAHPETRSVRGSNMCKIAVHRPQNGNVVIISSVIDNLVKGAAGQAIQNMNLMFELDETIGLTGMALQP